MKTDYKAIFLKQLEDCNVPLPDETEYQFMLSRNWKLDWAYKVLKIGIEYQGGTWMAKSGHSKGMGQVRDHHKGNHLALRGWLLICINVEMVKSGEAVWYVQQAIRTRKENLRYE